MNAGSECDIHTQSKSVYGGSCGCAVDPWLVACDVLPILASMMPIALGTESKASLFEEMLSDETASPTPCAETLASQHFHLFLCETVFHLLATHSRVPSA